MKLYYYKKWRSIKGIKDGWGMFFQCPDPTKLSWTAPIAKYSDEIFSNLEKSILSPGITDSDRTRPDLIHFLVSRPDIYVFWFPDRTVSKMQKKKQKAKCSPEIEIFF